MIPHFLTSRANQSFHRILPIVVSVFFVAIALADRPNSQKGLEPLNSLIGEWRGIGQPRRGSNQGAWKQTGEWVWDFSQEEVALQYRVSAGQLAESGRLTFDSQSALYLFELSTTDQQTRTYEGSLEENKLILTSLPDPEGSVHRMTLTLLNADRTLILHEKRETNQQRFFRVAEVGYTRAGVRLAKPGGGQPECIVTGGAGTIAVTYQGKTYYVCCSGCKQAFDNDPEGIIAEASKRRNQQRSKDN